jgi:hypothetical protein
MGLGCGIRDPGSGIRKKIYYGSPIQGSKRQRIPDPQHCILINKNPKKYFLKLFKHNIKNLRSLRRNASEGLTTNGIVFEGLARRA